MCTIHGRGSFALIVPGGRGKERNLGERANGDSLRPQSPVTGVGGCSEVPAGSDLGQGVADAVAGCHAQQTGLPVSVAGVLAAAGDVGSGGGELSDQISEAGHGVSPLGTPIA